MVPHRSDQYDVMYFRPMGDLGQILFMVSCMQTRRHLAVMMQHSTHMDGGIFNLQYFESPKGNANALSLFFLAAGVGCQEQRLHQTGIGAL